MICGFDALICFGVVCLRFHNAIHTIVLRMYASYSTCTGSDELLQYPFSPDSSICFKCQGSARSLMITFCFDASTYVHVFAHHSLGQMPHLNHMQTTPGTVAGKSVL